MGGVGHGLKLLCLLDKWTLKFWKHGIGWDIYDPESSRLKGGCESGTTDRKSGERIFNSQTMTPL